MNTTPTPDKKLTPMGELIEQLKKLSPESPMDNDVSKAFHEGIQWAILKATFLLEAEREYASQQAPEGMYTREQMYECALQFFYHWWNTPGNNTAQGLQEWLPKFIQSLK